MISQLGRRLGGRGLIFLFALVLSLPLAIGAYASSRHSASNKLSPKASPGSGETPDDASGSPGGPTPRFHGDGTTTCDWPDGVTAPTGSWTHGDYVNAWAKWAAQNQDGASRSDTIAAAAFSDCGELQATATAGGHEPSTPVQAKDNEQGSTHRP